MRRTITRALVLVGLSILAVGCSEKEGANPQASPESAQSAAAAATTAAAASAAPAASAAAEASAEPTASAAAAASAEPAASAAAETAPASTGAAAAGTATAAAAAAPSGSAAAGPKKFECGAKGQKMCPMQGWMKTVMANASQSGDPEKIANALSYVAARVPPGMGNWAQMARDGAAKAKAGDIDGAKASCKTCHNAYKDKYKSTMRDRPW